MMEEIHNLGVERFLKQASILGKLRGGVAGPYGHAAMEVGGLGAIATPYLADEMGKKMDKKTGRRLELAGLGTLAVPSLISAVKHFKKGR